MSRTKDLLASLGIELDPQLYGLALTHRSYAYEHGELPHNERLEFLGDAVLGVVVTQYLYDRFPESPEGTLAKYRAAVVNSNALAEVARGLEIGAELKLGKGELTTGGRDKTSILADATEALIGAIFVSAGRDSADRFVTHLFVPLIEDAATLGAALDWKTSLQELCAQYGVEPPVYEVTGTGPDHEKRFKAIVVFADWSSTSGEGPSKKRAEQKAAEIAFGELTQRYATVPATDASLTSSVLGVN